MQNEGTESESVPVNATSTQLDELQAPPTSAPPKNARTGAGSERFEAFDLLRGFIMITMSIDHLRDFCSFPVEHEQWDKPLFDFNHFQNYGAFFTRFITHLSAPGFSFLMGLSIILFQQSRVKAKWSSWQIIRYFLIRGIILHVINFTILNIPLLLKLVSLIVPGFQSLWALIVITVLNALGTNLILGAIFIVVLEKIISVVVSLVDKLVRRNSGELTIANSGVQDEGQDMVVQSKWADHVTAWTSILTTLFLAALCLVVNILVTPPESQAKEQFNPILLLTFVTGYYAPLTMFVVYPFMNWLHFTLYGIAVGRLFVYLQKYLRRGAEKFMMSLLLAAGAVMLVGFVIVRATNSWGNVQRPPNYTGISNPFLQSPMTFFMLTKYPPDLAFSLLTMSLDQIILFILYLLSSLSSQLKTSTATPGESSTSSSVQQKAVKALNALIDFILWPCRAFGKSALFFYMLHFLSYMCLAFIMSIAHKLSGTAFAGLDIVSLYIVWIASLVIMAPICAWYGRVKQKSSKDSILRFF